MAALIQMDKESALSKKEYYETLKQKVIKEEEDRISILSKENIILDNKIRIQMKKEKLLDIKLNDIIKY